MTLTHRIALDPNDRQETLLRQHAGWARFAWNWGVAEAQRALDAGEKSATSQYRLRAAFNRIKRRIAPWSQLLSQNPAKYALINLDRSWNRFWREGRQAKQAGRKVRRQYRPPRFHSRKRGMAFRADNGPDTVHCEGRTIHLPRIGRVRTREACRFAGPVRECTVKHDGIRWQAALVCKIAEPEPKVTGGVSGVDVGLRRLATVHDGATTVTFDNPRPLKWALVKLRRLNRRIARSRTIHGKARRSHRRERRYARRQRLYRRVTNLRLDAMHKATTAIAKRSRLVCIESLRVDGWMRNRQLSRATADASPSRFIVLLKWKCRREGVRVVEVGRFYPSSKTCSGCGVVNADLRFAETWCCPACGAHHHRDDNAALNLCRQGLAADVESVSDGREAAVFTEASTRQVILGQAR